jgi:hypothetical protein
MLVVTSLALGSGCAKSDWIQQTLVTVDVTGTWVGSIGAGHIVAEVRLELEQQGPRVTGSVVQMGPGFGGHAPLTGPLDGTIRGDVFSFALRNTSVQGELTVKGDEMNGFVGLRGKQIASLRRVSSSPRPAS